jgi:hypothetical protein
VLVLLALLALRTMLVITITFTDIITGVVYCKQLSPC